MRSLALLLFVAGTLPMAFVRPIIGLLLWMMFSYLNPHRMTWGFAVNFPWVMIVAIVTLTGLVAQPRQREALRLKPVIILMTLFLIWTAVSTSQAVLFDRAFDRFTELFKMMVMAYVTVMLVTDRQKLQWVIWVIVGSFGLWGAKGGLFTLLTGGSYHVMGPQASFFRDNNAFAMVMCMVIPLMRYVQIYTDSRWVRNGLWVMMGLTSVAVIGTYSRGGFLALCIVGFMLILKSRKRIGLLIVVPFLVFSIAMLMPAQYTSRIDSIKHYHQDTSAQGRINSWKFATNVALAHPLVGGGFEVWSSASMWNTYGPPGAAHRAIHSIFFEVLGELGFVGLALFVLILVVGYLGLARVKKQARAGPGLAWIGDLASMLQVSLIAFVAAGALLPMPYIDIFYQMIALVAVIQTLTARFVAEYGRSSDAKSTPGSRPHLPVSPGAPNHPESTYSASTASTSRRSRASRAARANGIQDLPPW